MKTINELAKQESWNLKETWFLCLEMWEWIAGEVKRQGIDNVDVGGLKRTWLLEHGFTGVEADCFFCHYNRASTCVGCDDCPAVVANKDFHCLNEKYHCFKNPITFYEKIVKLHKQGIEKGLIK